MKKWPLISCVIAMMCGFTSGATTVDSSDMLFNDTLIYKYNLHFYCDNWTDSLKYYKTANEQYIPARFTYYTPAGDSIVMDSIGVRYKGNASYTSVGSSSKKSFKFSFDKYIKGRNFFNVEKLNLNNNARDPSLMREKISYDILRKYMPAPRVVYADLYVDGSRIGVFSQVEQVDKNFLKRNYKNADCNLYKLGDDGATLEYLGVNQALYEDTVKGMYELKTNETENNWGPFIQLIYRLNNTPADSFIKVMNQSLNLDGCIRYTAFNMVFSNFDSYTGSARNYYLYDDSASGKFTLIPWDMGFSFGLYVVGNVKTVDILSTTDFDIKTRPLTKRIFENDSLVQVYFTYLKEFINGPASADSLAAMISRDSAVIDSAVNTDSSCYYGYNSFINNLDSTLYIKVPGEASAVTVYGLKPFCHIRDSNILAQIEKYLPVTYNVNSTKNNAAILKCSNITNGCVAIHFNVKQNNDPVKIGIYDCQGRLFKLFDEGTKTAGAYVRQWNVRNAPAGYYMVKLTMGNITSVAPVLISK